MKRISACLILGLFGFGPSWSQDTGHADTLITIPIPERPLLPANLFLYNTRLNLIPDNSKMFDINDYMLYDPNRPFIPNLSLWQKDFINRNGLRRLNFNSTVIDGTAMAWAIDNKSPANQEYHLNNVLMNQHAVGNTQLSRMNVRMREIRYFDILGAAKLGIIYLVEPEAVRNPDGSVLIRSRNRRK